MFHLFPEYEIGQLITIWEYRIIIYILKILSITSVPYHLLQAGATVKCLVPDSRHGIGYGYLSQAGAFIKCPHPDSCYGITYDKFFQRCKLKT